MFFPIPDLTIEMLMAGRVDRDLYYSSDVYELLDQEGYTDYGWLNSGNVKLPAGVKFTECYRSRSGATCINVNHQFRCYYSVDMGD